MKIAVSACLLGKYAYMGLTKNFKYYISQNVSYYIFKRMKIRIIVYKILTTEKYLQGEIWSIKI